eukprot:Skav233489  [mRNA]  locus=scaffold1310:183392:184901:+ [translate_table: standard]
MLAMAQCCKSLAPPFAPTGRGRRSGGEWKQRRLACRGAARALLGRCHSFVWHGYGAAQHFWKGLTGLSTARALAKFLLEEKLPRAFAIGKELGISFRLDRRIVHTARRSEVDVNTALLVAQRHHVADRFAELTLAAHFEQLEDPNDTKALVSRLEA